MFRIIRRLLGLAPKPAPKRIPIVSPQDDPLLAPISRAAAPDDPATTPRATQPDEPRPASSGVSRITVCFSAQREEPGTLKAFDAAGRLVSGPWPAVGKADPALAAAGGNPSCDRLQRFGDTPTGTYEVIGLLPAGSDARAVSRFGPHGILKLRPVSGEAAEADANGRTMLLIHGGDDPLAATDGSIRVPDPAMAEIVLLVPDDPSTLQSRIQVVVEDGAGYAEWRDADTARDDRYRSWARQPSETSPYTVSHNRADDDPNWWMNYYNQLYFWNVLDDPRSPDPLGQLPWQSDEDRAAAAALKAAGFDVQPDGHPQPAQDAGDAAAVLQAGLPDAGRASEAASDRAAPAAEPSFQPSGGSYDR